MPITESRIEPEVFKETPEVQSEDLLKKDPKLVISGFDNKPVFPQEVKKLVNVELPELLQPHDINADTLNKLLTTTAGKSQAVATASSLGDKVDRYAKALGILNPDSPQAKKVLSDLKTVLGQLKTINHALGQVNDADLSILHQDSLKQEQKALSLLGEKVSNQEPALDMLRIEDRDHSNLSPELKERYSAEADFITKSHQLVEAQKEEQAFIVAETKSKLTYGTASEELTKARQAAKEVVQAATVAIKKAAMNPKLRLMVTKSAPMLLQQIPANLSTLTPAQINSNISTLNEQVALLQSLLSASGSNSDPEIQEQIDALKSKISELRSSK
ncbi:MAG: hypothetical protein WCK42_08455 [Myxococcaceae bacterium]